MTAPVADVDEAVDLAAFLVELEGDPEAPCSWTETPTGPCPRPARYACRCARCHVDVLACVVHRRGVDLMQAEPFTVVSCAECSNVFPNPMSWRPI